MRRAVAIAVLVLASILLGSLAAGTPVAGNDTVAAVTAGINLSTAAAPRVVNVIRSLPQLRDLPPVILVVALLLVAGCLVVRLDELPQSRPALTLRARAHARRGPPAPA